LSEHRDILRNHLFVTHQITDMAIKLAINGFGRIGRLVARAIFENKTKGFDLVAVNDLTDANMLAYLFEKDSVHGKFPGRVRASGSNLVINGDRLKVFKKRDPEEIPWGDLDVDVVIESTGIFRTKASAGKHLKAGAKKVLISAPAGDAIDNTIVLGVNERRLRKRDKIVSNASCTTNCLAPMVQVLDKAFGVKQGLMTTIHGYTSDQRIQDAPHKDYRRARAAAVNMLPTTTGAAKAVGLVLPHLNGKLDGFAVRVPIPNGSMTDLTCVLKKRVTIEQVNNAFKKAVGPKGKMKGIIEYSDKPIVSSDIIHNPHSCIYDAPMTRVDGTMVKILGWYDNEWGYSNRVVDLAKMMAKK